MAGPVDTSLLEAQDTIGEVSWGLLTAQCRETRHMLTLPRRVALRDA